MTPSLNEPEVVRLAAELAEVTGETVTEAVVKSLEERLARERREVISRHVREELRAIRKRCAMLPVLDARSPEDLVSYAEDGLPH